MSTRLLQVADGESQLRQYLPLPLQILSSSIPEALLAHTTEEGSRQLLLAAIGGHEFELRGTYVGEATLREVPVGDYVLRDELQRRCTVKAGLGARTVIKSLTHI